MVLCSVPQTRTGIEPPMWSKVKGKGEGGTEAEGEEQEGEQKQRNKGKPEAAEGAVTYRGSLVPGVQFLHWRPTPGMI